MRDIIQFLRNFQPDIQVTILEDNIYEVSDYVYKKETFIELLSDLDFVLKGIDDREFSIELKNKDFTIQVQNFEFSEELEFN